jgi:hypothetical protein
MAAFLFANRAAATRLVSIWNLCVGPVFLYRPWVEFAGPFSRRGLRRRALLPRRRKPRERSRLACARTIVGRRSNGRSTWSQPTPPRSPQRRTRQTSRKLPNEMKMRRLSIIRREKKLFSPWRKLCGSTSQPGTNGQKGCKSVGFLCSAAGAQCVDFVLDHPTRPVEAVRGEDYLH